MDSKKLIELAQKARENAYAPYSGFKVGAALLCDDGTVYTGCNVENASFSPTMCAERVAFGKAVSEGKRNFTAIAVVGNTEPCTPCGVCRQVLSELCEGAMPVIFMTDAGITECRLDELFPYAFTLK